MAAAAKDTYYWGQLRSALTAGAWASLEPAKAPNAAPLPWAELFRKFNKHCKGFNDVAEIANRTQRLSILSTGKQTPNEVDLDGDVQAPESSLALDDECILAQEKASEAQKAYEELKGLEASSSSNSLKFALAYYAYALGDPEQCLRHLSEVSTLVDVSSHIPASGTNPPTSLGAPSQPAASAAGTPTGSIPADILSGKAWATVEVVRSLCLRGMSLEKLYPSDLSQALGAYISALPILEGIATEHPRPSIMTGGSGKLDFSSFNRYREVWRWSERLLWRAIIISAQDPSTNSDGSEILHKLFEQYRACTYPPTFRTRHRISVFNLHLRALVLKSRESDTLQLQRAHTFSRPSSWLLLARSVIQEYQAVLNASTYFPKAGDRNQLVEEFVDLCVAVWEAGGSIGDNAVWVIDILWWATRLTFNSYRIYRHMARINYAAGDSDLAVRFLRLYVQVVGKAHEAYAADGSSAGDEIGATLGVDDGEFDTDANWVRTCVHGARMLCRLALSSQGAIGIQQAREAGKMVEYARKRLKDTEIELNASVDLAEGIWNHVMSIKEQEPSTRMDRLTACASFLQRSIEAHPTPSAYHHLAIALSRPGPSHDLANAIECARSAVEGDASDVRHWHLLGLLEAADGEWKKARSVLEVGSGITDTSFATEEELALDEGATVDGIQARDFAVEGQATEGDDTEQKSLNNNTNQLVVPNGKVEQTVPLLEPGSNRLPRASSLFLPPPDYPVPPRRELFAYALQLRMSLLALSESVEGAEGVGDYWREVFAWYASRKVPDDEPSITSPRNSIRQSMSHITPAGSGAAIGPGTGEQEMVEGQQSLEAIPITLTPATPSHDTERHDIPSLEQSFSSFTDSTETASTEKDSTHSPSAGKKMQQIVKKSVTKSQARITTISRKIGHGVARSGSVHLRRTNSAPDLEQPASHASSIHARRFYAPSISGRSSIHTEKAPPPPLPVAATPPTPKKGRPAQDRRLLSDLWLMSAATFRRLGKIEQARGAIQEAEVTDDSNPAVWVQLGLYFYALGDERRAIETLNKALFVAPNDVSATIHLCRIHLARSEAAGGVQEDGEIDLAAGLLEEVTRGAGWDVPEAWYFLAKAYAAQGRRDRERECLLYSLDLSEGRGVREIGAAVGWCL